MAYTTLNRSVKMGVLMGAILTAAALALPRAACASLVLDLKAANYNAGTGAWTDSSGNGDNATATNGSFLPTLLTGATPNGSSAVVFARSGTSGDGSLILATGLNLSGGFTVLTFVDPTANSGNDWNNLLSAGGTGGTTAYAVSGEGVLRQSSRVTFVSGGVASNTNVPLGTFASTNVEGKTDGSGVAFRLNGAADGGGNVTSDASNQQYIGYNLTGKIAEIEVFDSVLTVPDIQTQEAAFQTAYVAAAPEPASMALLALGGIGLLARRRR